MTEFIVVRHGETDANRNGILAGHYPAKVTELGLEQGEAVAAYLKDIHIDRVYSSDLRRAMIIAGQIAGYHELPVHPFPQLREVYLGKWEGITPAQALEGWPEAYTVWLENQGYMQCPDGENTRQVIERSGSALKTLAKKHPGETVVIATHGYLIRTLYAACHNTPLEGFRAIPYVPNASVTRIVSDGDTLEMTLYGECDYLADMVTEVKWGG